MSLHRKIFTLKQSLGILSKNGSKDLKLAYK